MNLKTLSILSVVSGVTIASFAGSAIARHAGVGEHSWLMLAFGFGILLMSHGPVLKLQKQVRELQEQLGRSDKA